MKRAELLVVCFAIYCGVRPRLVGLLLDEVVYIQRLWAKMSLLGFFGG